MTPRHGTTGAPLEPRWCKQPACGTRVVLARIQSPGKWRGKWRPFNATPVEEGSPGAYVLLGSQAWTPADLVDHYRSRFQIGTGKARDLAEGYPWHTLHFHPPTSRDTNNEKEASDE